MWHAKIRPSRRAEDRPPSIVMKAYSRNLHRALLDKRPKHETRRETCPSDRLSFRLPHASRVHARWWSRRNQFGRFSWRRSPGDRWRCGTCRDRRCRRHPGDRGSFGHRGTRRDRWRKRRAGHWRGDGQRGHRWRERYRRGERCDRKGRRKRDWRHQRCAGDRRLAGDRRYAGDRRHTGDRRYTGDRRHTGDRGKRRHHDRVSAEPNPMLRGELANLQLSWPVVGRHVVRSPSSLHRPVGDSELHVRCRSGLHVNRAGLLRNDSSRDLRRGR
jgi:hypothetical protein